MKAIGFIVFSLLLAACTSQAGGTAPGAKPTPLPDLGTAPELTGDTWLNTPAPLRPEDLRGRVVLVDMWTFG